MLEDVLEIIFGRLLTLEVIQNQANHLFCVLLIIVLETGSEFHHHYVEMFYRVLSWHPLAVADSQRYHEEAR